MMRNIAAGSAAILMLFSINLNAEEPTVNKDKEVVVTASRYPTSLKDTPAKVIVIDEQEINQSGAGQINDVIKLLPQAIELFPAFAIRQRRDINLRGFSELGHTLVLLDGIPLYTEEDNVPWHIIPSEAIERVEIVPGPLSSLYGSGAMGGVINMMTRTPKEKEITSVKGSSGSLGTYSSSISYLSRPGPFSYYLLGKTSDSDGYIAEKAPKSYNTKRKNDGWSGMLKTAYNPDADSNITLSWVGGALDWNRGRTFNHQERQNNLTSLTYQKQIDQAELTALLFYNDETGKIYSDKSPAYSSVNNIQYLNPLHRSGGTFKLNCPLGKNNHLMAGIDSVRSDYEEKTVTQATSQRTGSKGKQTRTGIFAEDRLKLLDDKLVTTIAARWDYWKSYDGFFYSTSPATSTDYASTDGSVMSYKIGAVYHLDSQTDLRAALGSGINIPYPGRLYSTRLGSIALYGNPNLNPEKLISYDLGVDRRFNDRLSASLTSYLTYVDDYMGVRLTSPTVKTRDNLSKVEIKGLEPEVKYRINQDLMASVGYVFNESIITEDQSTPSAKDNDLSWVPRRKGLWRLNYANQSVGQINLTAYYMGRRYDNLENTLRLDDYWAININFSRRFSDYFSINLGIDNIFNQKYDVPASGDQPLEAPGRLMTLGLKTEF